MKTEADLAYFLRAAEADAIVLHKDIIEIFNVGVRDQTLNDWCRKNGLKFEASISSGTVAQWSFRRKP